MGNDYRVGVGIEELPPGNQSSPAHYHIFEKEHVYILEGALTVRIGTETYEMKAGDYVCFLAGQKAGHRLINNSGAPSAAMCSWGSAIRTRSLFIPIPKSCALRRGSIFDLAARRGAGEMLSGAGWCRPKPNWGTAFLPYHGRSEAGRLCAAPSQNDYSYSLQLAVRLP
jgi:hypothetical protein